MITPIWTYDNIQCFVNNTQCCIGDKGYDYLIKLKQQGITQCMKDDVYKQLFLGYQNDVLSRYAPEGDIIVDEVRAEFSFIISSVTATYSLSVTVGGVLLASATVQLGDTPTDFAQSLIALIPAAYSPSLSQTATTGAVTVTLLAPVGQGAAYNGTPVVLGFNPLHMGVRTFYAGFDVFRCGVSQVVADIPCITDIEARKIYETLDSACGGGCGCN